MRVGSKHLVARRPEELYSRDRAEIESAVEAHRKTGTLSGTLAATAHHIAQDCDRARVFEEIGIRLVGLNQLGAFIQGLDGHYWIQSGGEEYLRGTLTRAGILLNDKIYGGLLQALDTVDEALRLAGNTYSLYNHGIDALESSLELGYPGIDASRIDRTEPGKGGIH